MLELGQLHGEIPTDLKNGAIYVNINPIDHQYEQA